MKEHCQASRKQRMDNLRGAFVITRQGRRWIESSPPGTVFIDDVLRGVFPWRRHGVNDSDTSSFTCHREAHSVNPPRLEGPLDGLGRIDPRPIRQGL